jgi:D-amino-acid dehydrogenase
MTQSFDLVVVGGGIVGASAAYHAARSGAHVLMVDRMDRGRATDAGAGILAPEMNRRDPAAWFDLAVAAVGYYPEMIAALAADGFPDTGYARCGMLLAAATPDEITLFEEAKRMILARQRQRNAPSSDELYVTAAGEARKMFPPLAQVYGAIYFRGAARVDGRLLGRSLTQAAERHGATIRTDAVSSLLVGKGRVTGVVVSGEEIGAGTVIIAGGAWSAYFGEQLGVQIPVEPQRGQIAHLDLPGAENSGEWPIVMAFGGHYLVPWPGGRIVAGATRETGAGFEPRTTLVGIQEVLAEAVRVAPGLGAASLREIRVGLRPLTHDGLPVLGRVPGVDGVLLATGHGPTGLQLGPYSGKLMAEMALGTAREVDLSAYAVTRFRQ